MLNKVNHMKNLIISIIMVIPLVTFAQLTGYWQTDAGGCYQVRQDGNEVWWIGERGPEIRSSITFHGVLAGNQLTGQWCDMPSHDRQNCGEGLTLRIEDNNRMVKTGETAAYYGKVWTRTSEENCSDCVIVWQSDLTTCTPILCGDYPANNGEYLGKAEIIVCSDETVKVNLSGIINKQTGKNIGAVTFEVYYLTFNNQNWEGDSLGSFTTDANGNFSGEISGTVSLPINKSFVLNANGRSQFITR
jgi:hypothetical protein